MSKELTIIVPAYDEEEGIESTVKKISEYNPDSEILVVDDGSTDNTLRILREIKKKNPNLKIISHKKNKGYGGALKIGFYNAKTKYIAFLDADLTYHPKCIKPLLSTLINENLDVVWGNRFGGKNLMPFIRKIGNKILVVLLFIMTGKHVPDTASGERVFKVEILDKINCKTLPNGLSLTPAMTKRIVKRKLRFRTISIDYYMRSGSSKLNIFNDFIRMALDIIFQK